MDQLESVLVSNFRISRLSGDRELICLQGSVLYWWQFMALVSLLHPVVRIRPLSQLL